MVKQSGLLITDIPDNSERKHAVEDEELAFRAKNHGCVAAREEILLRAYHWSNRWIAWLARRQGFAPSDVEDAQQDAVFGILKAVQRFDPLRIGEGKQACFRTFLYRILSDRFKDFAKQLRRKQDRALHSTGASNLVDGERRTCCLDEWADPERANDPAVRAELNEFRNLFWRAVERLNGAEYRLVSALLSGHRLRMISREMAISYDSAKRLRRHLRGHLRRLESLLE